MITTRVSLDNPGVLFLGRKGEEGARKFIFDVGSWASDLLSDDFTRCEYRLLVLRPREKTPYQSDAYNSDEGLIWVPTPADFAKAGEGRIEIQFISDAKAILKSAVIRTRSEGCIGDTEGPAPEDKPGWFDSVLKATEDAKEAAEEAQKAARESAGSAEAAETACNILVATYNKTTWAELKAAYDAGKHIEVERSGFRYGLYNAYANYMEFRHPGTSNVPYCRCYISGMWVYSNYVLFATPNAHASRHGKNGADPITPEDIGAISALGESITDPEVNIDDLVLTKCYLCGATVIKNGLKGDLAFQASHLLKVEDFTGDGRRAIQTAVLNNTNSPQRKWRLWNGYEWSAWVDG